MPDIHPMAVVHPKAELADGVSVGPFAIVDEHVRLGPGCRVWPHAHLTGHLTAGADNQFHTGCVVGHWPQHTAYDPSVPSYLDVGDRNVFREQCIVHGSFAEGKRTTIGDDNFLMHQAHVGHDCAVGNKTTIASCAMVAGHVLVEDRAFISGVCGVHQHSRVGRMAMVGAVSRCNRDLPPFMLLVGDSEVVGLNVVAMRRGNLDAKVRQAIRTAYKTLYFKQLTVDQATARIYEQADACGFEEVRHIADFLAGTKRGICHHKPLKKSLKDDATDED